MKIEKQNYSRGAWRVLHDDGRQLYERRAYPTSGPGGYHYPDIWAPVCFERKSDASAWIAAYGRGEGPAVLSVDEPEPQSPQQP